MVGDSGQSGVACCRICQRRAAETSNSRHATVTCRRTIRRRVTRDRFHAVDSGAMSQTAGRRSIPPDKSRGCLLGLAVGDAIGTTVEFRPRGSFEPLTDMVGAVVPC